MLKHYISVFCNRSFLQVQFSILGCDNIVLMILLGTKNRGRLRRRSCCGWPGFVATNMAGYTTFLWKIYGFSRNFLRSHQKHLVLSPQTWVEMSPGLLKNTSDQWTQEANLNTIAASHFSYSFSLVGVWLALFWWHLVRKSCRFIELWHDILRKCWGSVLNSE